MVLKASSLENATLMRYGDINNDGKIDQKDLALLQEFLNGTKTPTQLQKELASVSGDRNGELKQRDLELLKNYIDKQNGLTPDAGTDYNREATGKTGVIYGIGDVTEAIEILASNSKVEIDMNHAQIYTNFDDDIFHIHNPEGICIESGGGDIKLESYNEIIMKRFDTNAPTLKLTGNVLNFTDPNTPDLKHQWELIKDGTNQKAHTTTGKTIQEYDLNNKFYNILANDTTRMNVYPQFYMQNSRNRCIGTLYFGPDDGNDKNYFRKNNIHLDNDGDDRKFFDVTSNIVSATGPSSAIHVWDSNAWNSSVDLYGIGFINLSNKTEPTRINFVGKNSNSTAEIWHSPDDNIIHIDDYLAVKNDLTTGGDAIVNGGDIKIINKNGTSNLWFSDGTKTYRIYHLNGEDKLHINTNLNMDNNNIENCNNLYVNNSINIGVKGSDGKYPITLDKNGNLNAKGDITGKRVFGAVYNDYGEIFRKDKDEVIEYGDIVCLRDDGLVHKVSNEDDMCNIIGICSDTIGMCLGGADVPEDEQCPVGIVGKIWVKTQDETIKTGDHVLATISGNVCKAIKKSENKFGIVMQGYKDGKVLIFIK